VSLWGRLFAAGYDHAMAPVERRGMAARRGRLLAGLEGKVVELGAGTGANLAAYGPGVQELLLCEPDRAMARRLTRGLTDGRARVLPAAAEALPLADRAADAVVATLVLCTVADPDAALAEARRVLRPGGRLVFAEHVRAEDRGLARVQDLLAPVQRVVGRGCHPNRDTLGALARGGWEVRELERARLDGAPAYLAPLVAGWAVPA
jgi:ubiquinone/menaquinone biosynthesis C-methylase UbiE